MPRFAAPLALAAPLLAALLLAGPASASGSMSTSFWQKVEAEWLAKYARQQVMNPTAGQGRRDVWTKPARPGTAARQGIVTRHGP